MSILAAIIDADNLQYILASNRLGHVLSTKPSMKVDKLGILQKHLLGDEQLFGYSVMTTEPYAKNHNGEYEDDLMKRELLEEACEHFEEHAADHHVLVLDGWFETILPSSQVKISGVVYTLVEKEYDFRRAERIEWKPIYEVLGAKDGD